MKSRYTKSFCGGRSAESEWSNYCISYHVDIFYLHLKGDFDLRHKFRARRISRNFYHSKNVSFINSSQIYAYTTSMPSKIPDFGRINHQIIHSYTKSIKVITFPKISSTLYTWKYIQPLSSIDSLQKYIITHINTRRLEGNYKFGSGEI